MHKWWKIITGVLVLGLVVVGLTACGKKSAASKNTLVVATSGTLYPTSYHDSKTKKLTGYDVEVVRTIAKKLHKKVVFKEYSVDGMLTAVKTGKADMAVDDFAISPTRKKKFAMSIAFKHSFNSIIVRSSDNSGINSWADLKDKKAGGEAGTNYQRLAQQLGAKLVNYDNVSNDVYLRDLQDGKTDFIMNDYYLQKLALAANPNSGLKIMPNMYFTTNEDGSGEGIIMSKDDPKLTKEVNSALKTLLKDGTIKKLAMKFYGADVTKQPSEHISKHFTISSKYTGRN